MSATPSNTPSENIWAVRLERYFWRIVFPLVCISSFATDLVEGPFPPIPYVFLIFVGIAIWFRHDARVAIPAMIASVVAASVRPIYVLMAQQSWRQMEITTTWGAGLSAFHRLWVLIIFAVGLKFLRDQSLRIEAQYLDYRNNNERERRNLAHALHDGVGQSLAMIALKLNAMKEADGHVKRKDLNECSEFLRLAEEQTREVAQDLRPVVLEDLGLEMAVRELVERTQKASNLNVHFDASCDTQRRNHEMELPCFRMIQETLTNVIRHAQAKQVWIDLVQCDSEIRCEIRDDGMGFEPSAVRTQSSNRKSFGLRNLLQHVESIGGSAEIDASPGNGCRIEIVLPFSKST